MTMYPSDPAEAEAAQAAAMAAFRERQAAPAEGELRPAESTLQPMPDPGLIGSPGRGSETGGVT